MSDIGRGLVMVSLDDSHRRLKILLESARDPLRPRWIVAFRDYPAYRNIDEAYRLGLWKWLDDSKQRCGSTFRVVERSPQESWSTDYLHSVVPGIQHWIIATEDDVIEVLSAAEPEWETAEPAPTDADESGKSRHLYRGEDDEEIEGLFSKIKNRPQKTDAG